MEHKQNAPDCERCGTEKELAVTSSNIKGFRCPRCDDPNDGFNVVDEVSRSEWVDYEVENFDEYVHVIADMENRELRCYRTVNEGFPSKRVKTTIEDVKIRANYDRDSESKLRGFYLTWRQADSFITLVDLLASARKEGSLMRLQWYENNKKPAHKDSRVNDETISFTFTKKNGQERHLQIMETWIARSNQMAKYDNS